MSDDLYKTGHEYLVDGQFEDALVNLIAVWASGMNPLQSPDEALRIMDRFGELLLRAGAVYGDIHIMESGHALQREAKALGYDP